MTEELVRVLVVGLAAWRVASLLVSEGGPFDVFARLRRWQGAEIRLEELPVGDEPLPTRRPLAGVLQCVWCMSPWLALVFWGLWEIHWAIPGVVAAAAVAVLADNLEHD